MAVKSVVDVQVNAEEFARFNDIFNKYSEKLAKLPGAWGKAGEAQSELGAGLEKMTAALLAQSEIAKSNDDDEEKRLKRLTLTERLWTSISRSSTSIAKNVLDIGSGILRWGGLIAGVATGASLFGIDRLGYAAGDQRRASLGQGLSIGEQKAFGNSFGRFVDPGSFLGGVNAAVSDVSKQGSLYSIGVNPNQSTADVAVQTLQRIRALALATPVNQLGILESSRHLDQLGVSTEDLRRLRSATPDEFNRQIGTYRSGVAALNIDNKTAEAWQNFTQQIEKAGGQIFKVLVQGLMPLSGPLSHLSDSIVKAVERFVKGGTIEKGIDTFASWIDKLSTGVAKPEFLSKIDRFVTGVGEFAETASNILGFAAHPIDNVGRTWSAAISDASHQDFLNNVIKGQAAQFGVPWELLAAQWQQESSGATGGVIRSKKGAMGVMGLMPDTARDLGVSNPDDPVQSVYGGAKYDAQLLRKYGGDIAKLLAAYNWGPGNLDKDIAKYGKDWMAHLPTETSNYIRDNTKNAGLPGQLHNNLTVTVNNNTGGNANTALAAQ